MPHYCKKHRWNRCAERVTGLRTSVYEQGIGLEQIISTSQQLDCLLSYLILSTRLTVVLVVTC